MLDGQHATTGTLLDGRRARAAMLDGRRDAVAGALPDGPRAARLGGRLERPAVAGWAETPGCQGGGRTTKAAGTFLSEHVKLLFSV